MYFIFSETTQNSEDITVENSERSSNVDVCENVLTITASDSDILTCTDSDVQSFSDSEVLSSSDSELDSLSDSEIQFDSDLETDSSSDSEIQPSVNLTQTDKEMMLLSCFIKNHLPASACKDILSTLKKLFPDCTSLQQIKYECLWKSVVSKLDDIHYCENCSRVFPDDPEEFSCRTVGCSGLRYIGTNQTARFRRPRTSFVLTDEADQIKNLLEMPGTFVRSTL